MGVYRLGKWIHRRSGLIRLSKQFLLRLSSEFSFMTTWAVSLYLAIAIDCDLLSRVSHSRILHLRSRDLQGQPGRL